MRRSRVFGTDVDDDAVYVRRDREGNFKTNSFPVVQLSFVDPTPSIYFTTEMVQSKRFSSTIQHLVRDNLPNVATSFVKRGVGWDGSRVVPIKFFRNREPCMRRVPRVRDFVNEFARIDAMSKRDRASAHVRAMETNAMDASTVDGLPLSRRRVTLLHWITDDPAFWTRISVTDKIYTPQWLDTHSHPAWYYPGAATTKGRRVLLAITVDAKTPMLRIERHNANKYRMLTLTHGEWVRAELDPHETEVRLPPGLMVVSMPPTKELYAGEPIIFVQLRYEPWTFPTC